MLGNPKYKEGDVVRFDFLGDLKTGIIAIVDEYGVFEDSSDVHYDILDKEHHLLHKHVHEKWVFEKTGEVNPNTIWD